MPAQPVKVGVPLKVSTHGVEPGDRFVMRSLPRRLPVLGPYPYLNGVLGEIAASASRTGTLLGERYRRLARRCGKRKALVALARSISSSSSACSPTPKPGSATSDQTSTTTASAPNARSPAASASSTPSA